MHLKQKIAILALVVFFFCFSVAAQQSKQYSFKHFTVNDGLASTNINNVVQDKDGFIWLATDNGLQRFDGSRFITFLYNASNPSSIPDNRITHLYIDKEKQLWLIAANRKIGVFDTKKFNFTEVPVKEQKDPLFLSQSFFETHDNAMLLLKNNGNFLKFDRNKKSFIQAKDIIPAPSNWRRTWVYWDDDYNKYWISCDSGLVQYDPVTKHLNYRNHNIDKDPVIEAFKDITAPVRAITDVNNNVIFIRWPYHAPAPVIHRYNRKLKKAEVFSSGQQGYHEIDYFLKQKNGRLWLYGKPVFAEWTERNGQSLFNIVPNAYRNEHSLKFDYMHDVYEDKEGNIWLATDNGLFLFNPDKQIFNSYYVVRPDGKPPFEAIVQAVAQLPDGRIFVGCWGGGGITCYDKDFNPLAIPPLPPKGDLSTWDMSIHPKTGELWLTMQAGSIIIYNPKTNSFRRVIPEVFNLETIRQVDEDTSGNLWFGTHKGKLVKWDYRKSGGDPTKGYELVMETGMIVKVHYDYKGYIWVGVLEHGLFKLDATSGKVLKKFTADGPNGERLFSNVPTDMTYYNDSILLVTAGCVNVINTKTNKITYVGIEEGLPSNTANSIEKDENGIVWVGMRHGLCRLNFEKKLVSFYDRRDGITEEKFNMAGVKELLDGRLVFFTPNNMLVFHPDQFRLNHVPTAPKITSFTLAGKQLSVDSLMNTQRVVLPHNNTSISLSFSGLSFLPQQKTHYYYMLENLDKDWIRTDKPLEVVYNYLPSGEYFFKVKSENADGLANGNIASLHIKVNPPFWKTWWFISLVVLLVVTVLYFIDKERMQRRKSLQNLRRQIRGNLRDEVNSTLNNINVLSEMAKIKADKNVVQAKDYIDKISDQSRQMIEVMDDTLWSIDPQNDSMEHSLLRIKEVTENIMMSTGADIDLIVDKKVQKLQLDMKMRYNLFFYYKEALTFLLRQTNTKQLFVNINLLRSRLVVEILSEYTDDSFKKMKEKFEAALQKRIKALPADIDVLVDGKTFSAGLYIYLK